MLLKVKKSKMAYDISYAHPNDAGFDIKACDTIIIPPQSQVLINTGLSFEIPDTHYLLITGRSGLAERGIWAFNGTIDSGYRGEVGVILMNFNKDPYYIEKGDKIAQGLVIPIANEINGLQIKYVDSLSESKRGENGFGSTGK